MVMSLRNFSINCNCKCCQMNLQYKNYFFNVEYPTRDVHNENKFVVIFVYKLN